MNHTPTPWTIHDANRFGEFGDNGPSICAEISADTCQPLLEFVGPADGEVCKANAEFIVRAVNSHDELVAALASVRILATSAANGAVTARTLGEALGRMVDIALAKAETP